MLKNFSFVIVFYLLCGVTVIAHADETYNEVRGQLLYSTHCQTCHTDKVHWRSQKKVTDWSSLVTQVRRWQDIAGLAWSDDEINDVAQYLKRMFYEFKDTAQDMDTSRILYKGK